ncbi:MAG TPA: ATP-binding protein [Bryobacteraceae bacterium]|jgi:light-regulated signal transduction histidine kinase (bacteriophytochrome)
MELLPNPPDLQLAEALAENERLKSELAKAAGSGEEALQHFIYAASHDLQEPLRMVLTYAQLLQRQFPDDERAQEFTSFIISGVGRMNGLIQNLLVYSRVGTSKRRSAVNLNACLQWALLKLAPAIKESGAAITHDELPEVQADETEMAQVFENLIGNALKFRDTNSPHIHISAEEGSGEWILSVRDNGTGVDPRFLEQVLLPFKRLHGKGVPGSGLGLAICDKVVRSHAGRIWVESDGQQGTSVHFTIAM